MAALTWKNVDAPDYRTAMAGFEKFGQMINQSLGQVKSGIKEFDDITTDNMNRALALELAAEHGDPEAYKASLADRLAKYDPRRISFENLTAANAKVGQLSQEQLTALNIEDTQGNMAEKVWSRGNEHRRFDALAGLAPYATEIATLQQMNTPEANAKIATIMSSPEFKTAFSRSGLTAQDTFGFVKDVQGIESGALGNANTRQNMDQDKILFDRGTLTYEEDRDADTLAYNAFKATGGTSAEALLGYMQDKGKSPHVIQAAIRKIPGYESFFLPQSGAGAGLDVETPSGSVSFGGASGTTAQHDEMATALKGLGYDTAFAAAAVGNSVVEAGYTGLKGDDGTAAGHFQWREGRRANFKRIIGKDPSKATPAESARFMDWEFKHPVESGAFVKKNGKTPQQQVAMILGERDPERKAALIDEYYERSDGKARGRRQQAARQTFDRLAALDNKTAGSRGMSELSEGGSEMAQVLGRVQKNWNADTDIGTVTQNLLASPTFKGADAQYIATELKKLVDNHGVNYAQAGAIMLSSAKGRGRFEQIMGGTFGSRNRWNRSGALAYDEEHAAQLGNMFGSRDRNGNLVRNKRAFNEATTFRQTQSRNRSQLAAAQARVAALQKDVATYAAAVQAGRRGAAPELGRLQGLLEQAIAMQDAIASQTEDQSGAP